MAKKKIPSVDDAIKTFKTVSERAGLSDYLYVNKTIFSKNPKGNTVVLIPDQALWLKILDDPDLKDHLKELNLNDSEQRVMMDLIPYCEDLKGDEWVEVDPEILFSGKVFKISLKGFEYEVPINRGLLPLKLRKAEYNNIRFRVFTKPTLVLALKKRFDFPDVEECGFEMIRMFQVI